MEKNLSDAESAQLIINRFRKLSDTAKSRWGSMSLNGMLWHCSEVNTAILEGKLSDKTPTFKQWLIKNLVLNVRQQLPKGIKTNPKFVKNEQQDLQTNIEKEKVIDSIIRFTNHTNLPGGEHPVFGRLNDKEWGRFAWLHMDHHLRQFGG